MLPIFKQNGPTTLSTDSLFGFDSVLEDFNKVLDDTLHSYGYSSIKNLSADFIPPLEVVEKENEYFVTLECCGLEKSNLSVTINNDNRLILSGEKTDSFEKETGKRLIRERNYGTFRREIRLPLKVDTDNIKVSFDNGVLTAIIPKIEEKEKQREIEIT